MLEKVSDLFPAGPEVRAIRQDEMMILLSFPVRFRDHEIIFDTFGHGFTLSVFILFFNIHIDKFQDEFDGWDIFTYSQTVAIRGIPRKPSGDKSAKILHRPIV